MTEKDRIYLDVHVLQTVPPSCVNRDDTGSPKTAVYGGTTRARVSSQAWKRAMRLAFRDIFDSDKLGQRTKRIPGMVADEIKKLGYDGDAAVLATDVVKAADIKLKAETDVTDALFFMSEAQARTLAEFAVEDPEFTSSIVNTKKPDKDEAAKFKAAKAKLHDLLKTAPSIDLALFGRMVASDPSLNFDAAAQVAHSISTHTVHNEYDYFTAVDDRAPEDNAGAGHIGTVEFNSATLYRYATVNVRELWKSLGEDTLEASRGFIEAFVKSMPTGKQNTFANRTLPDFVYVTIRRDQPINLAGAFEKPVAALNGYGEASAERLAEYAVSVYDDFAGKPEFAFGSGKGAKALVDTMPFGDLLGAVEEKVGSLVNEVAE